MMNYSENHNQLSMLKYFDSRIAIQTSIVKEKIVNSKFQLLKYG